MAIQITTLIVCLTLIGCGQKPIRPTVQNEEPGGPNATAAGMVSTVAMNNPAMASQLTSGFYAIEENSWRWTSHRFSVVLKTPPGASQRGATLVFRFTLPAVVVGKAGPVTLRAASGATALESEIFKEAGAHTFSAAVPISLLTGESLPVDFSLDKFLPPNSAGDNRELGIIASVVELDLK